MANPASKKRLGILLSTPPDHANLQTAIGLSEAALADQMDVYLYLIDEGVHSLDSDRLLQLSKDGVKLFACAYAAQRRGIPLSDKATFCGLVVFSDLVKGCDRFVALN